MTSEAHDCATFTVTLLMCHKTVARHAVVNLMRTCTSGTISCKMGLEASCLAVWWASHNNRPLYCHLLAAASTAAMLGRASWCMSLRTGKADGTDTQPSTCDAKACYCAMPVWQANSICSAPDNYRQPGDVNEVHKFKHQLQQLYPALRWQRHPNTTVAQPKQCILL
jgi:hypothetical protein